MQYQALADMVNMNLVLYQVVFNMGDVGSTD